ncbi:hypothetical protein F5144DRAFT_201179 [Chaetomium tenue]|uniref:Uncharacterized protein n=1 Tax=Chaetomium tenue TaxID=1854479 RepID=A0ACB7PD04_9PEZI|nr:hypothetical protein F5144DRAFT_201179 [Chaetomium globosum]
MRPQPCQPGLPGQAKPRSGDYRPLGGTVTEETIELFPFASCHHMGPRKPSLGCSCTGLFRRSLRRLPRDSRSSMCAPFGKVLAVSVPLTQCAAGEPRMDISGARWRELVEARTSFVRTLRKSPKRRRVAIMTRPGRGLRRHLLIPLGQDDGEQPAFPLQRGTANETFSRGGGGLVRLFLSSTNSV